MTNARLRMGRLFFELNGEKRRTRISVPVDRMVAEVDGPSAKSGQAHLLSVVGTDAEIAAIAAAIGKNSGFLVEAPGLDPFGLRWEGKAACYRGSLTVPGRNRPLRHLIAFSERWLIAALSTDPDHIFVLNSSPEFVWTNVSYIYGLPGLPEWAEWFHLQLTSQRSIVPLLGIGCEPSLVRGSQEQFLRWLGDGVRAGELVFPPNNGPVVWPKLALESCLRPQTNA
jgi:hypothetical protein